LNLTKFIIRCTVSQSSRLKFCFKIYWNWSNQIYEFLSLQNNSIMMGFDIKFKRIPWNFFFIPDTQHYTYCLVIKKFHKISHAEAFVHVLILWLIECEHDVMGLSAGRIYVTLCLIHTWISVEYEVVACTRHQQRYQWDQNESENRIHNI
jgi:hypothetical protein